MKIKIEQLNIYTNNDVVRFSFDSKITFIYGSIGVGKTTLLSIIVYCFGGDLVETPAVDDQFASAEVHAIVNDRKLVFRREFKSSRIFVNSGNDTVKSLDKKEISNYLYEKSGVRCVYYDRQGVDTPNQLTFKNYLWYSYLKQSDIDNNFFYLGGGANEFYQIASTNTLASLLGKTSFVNEEQKKVMSNSRRRLRKFENGIYALNYVYGEESEKSVLSEYSRLEEERVSLLSVKHDDGNSDEVTPIDKVSFQLELVKYKLSFLNNFMTIKHKHDKFIREYLRLKEQVSNYERNALTEYDSELKRNLNNLGDIFKECLIAIGFPSVSKSDKVFFNMQNLNPTIVNEYTNSKYSFDSLGSGGKKTLYKICFLLAVHIQSETLDASNNRLPSFVIIDTPMKNISEREDKELFDNFYIYLLKLSNTILTETQFIIIDKEKNSIITDDNANILFMSKENPLFPEFIDE